MRRNVGAPPGEPDPCRLCATVESQTFDNHRFKSCVLLLVPSLGEYIPVVEHDDDHRIQHGYASLSDAVGFVNQLNISPGSKSYLCLSGMASKLSPAKGVYRPAAANAHL